MIGNSDEDEAMCKTEPPLREDPLLSQYRDIGPAVLVAALMSNPKRREVEKDNIRRSILAVKKPRYKA